MRDSMVSASGLTEQSKKFIERSSQYLFHTASHLCYHAKLNQIINPTYNFDNSGFPSTRLNLSPFIKDFRGGKQPNESVE